MAVKLEVENLYKVFGKTPDRAFPLLAQGLDKDEVFRKTGLTVGVKNASLAINQGEIFVVMGLSGSGKSTLVRLLNRLIEPTRGHVYLDGRDIAAISAEELRRVRRKKISMVFQSFALMPHLNVLDNTAFGLELAGTDTTRRRKIAMDTLARVGLDAYTESYPDELSGGMQQRVGLARALANDPDVLLMDEAFSALDPLIRTEMQDELLRLQDAVRRTVVFISHDLDEAMRIGDRIAIMQDGEVVQVGTPDDILRNPANNYVRSFFKGVDVSNVFKVKDVARKKTATVIKKTETGGAAAALQLLDDHDREFAVVVDKTNHYIGTVSSNSLLAAADKDEPLTAALLGDTVTLHPDTTLAEVIGDVARVPYPIPVVDEDKLYHGVISKSRLLHALNKKV